MTLKHYPTEDSGPVDSDHPDKDPSQPEKGVALCLSGGGYRAMVFHLGALWRLNEVGLLKSLKRISSVSGGSITAGVLGLRWKELTFAGNVATNLNEKVIDPVRSLASITIDAPAILKGIFLPGDISSRVVAAYDAHLFGGATLQHLPSDNEGPRFVINATNVQTGALWRFSKPYMRDYMVGCVLNPETRLAIAVAASSAFPPVLSPLTMKLDPGAIATDNDCPLQRKPFTTKVVLADGGVYDNLGLETVWKRYQTVLVSDGGGKIEPEEQPKHDWAQHAYRVLNIIDNQVRSLRKRQVIGAFQSKYDMHDGTYWGIRTHIKDYQLPDALPCPEDRTVALAETPTRLKAMGSILQERLINWGYAVCDAAIRTHVDPKLVAPKGLPYPASGV